MAKALAEYFFSDRARLTRFDMSEYATPYAVARLIGAGGGERVADGGGAAASVFGAAAR